MKECAYSISCHLEAVNDTKPITRCIWCHKRWRNGMNLLKLRISCHLEAVNDMKHVTRCIWCHKRWRNGMNLLKLRISCHLDADYGMKDRKSTRLNSSHVAISYAVFCLKNK